MELEDKLIPVALAKIKNAEEAVKTAGSFQTVSGKNRFLYQYIQTLETINPRDINILLGAVDNNESGGNLVLDEIKRICEEI